MIDIEDYTDLAWHHVNRSNKKHLQGVEMDDLYQHAMIGIWTASLAYDNSKGSFTTYAHKYIQGEINNLIYKREGGERVPRVTEPLAGDIDVDTHEAPVLYEDNVEDDEFLDSYITTLPLKDKLKEYFVNLIKYGDKEATLLYVDKHRVTRQRAHQVKTKIREITQKHLRRLGHDSID